MSPLFYYVKTYLILNLRLYDYSCLRLLEIDYEVTVDHVTGSYSFGLDIPYILQKMCYHVVSLYVKDMFKYSTC